MPDLSDLTPAELAEAALANPQVFAHIASKDPRVQLMERLYGDPEAKRAIQSHSKRLFPKASVPEIDLPEAIRGELKDDLDAVKKLRTELEDEKKGRRRQSFRARLQEAGGAAEDLDDIETFMVDNEIGPKSLTVAVEKFYESKELAEPRGAALSDAFVADAKDEQMKALLTAGPGADLDKINEPFVEAVFQDMFGQRAGRRGRA